MLLWFDICLWLRISQLDSNESTPRYIYQDYKWMFLNSITDWQRPWCRTRLSNCILSALKMSDKQCEDIFCIIICILLLSISCNVWNIMLSLHLLYPLMKFCTAWLILNVWNYIIVIASELLVYLNHRAHISRCAESSKNLAELIHWSLLLESRW